MVSISDEIVLNSVELVLNLRRDGFDFKRKNFDFGRGFEPFWAFFVRKGDKRTRLSGIKKRNAFILPSGAFLSYFVMYRIVIMNCIYVIIINKRWRRIGFFLFSPKEKQKNVHPFFFLTFAALCERSPGRPEN
jgi:hypothetical protein